MTVVIHQVPQTTDGDPHPLVAALADAERRSLVDLYGHDDFATGLGGWLVSMTPTPYLRCEAWVALPAGVSPDACLPSDAVGFAQLDLPLAEDTSTGQFFCWVTADDRGRGLGSALFERALDALGGRTVVQTYGASPEADPADDDVIVAASGEAVKGDASTRWLQKRGFTLELIERYARLDLDATDAAQRAALAALEADAAAAAGDDYEVVSWQGPVPDDLLDDIAEANRRFSVDVPLGGLEADEQVWDAARVAFQDQRMASRQRDRARTAVRHRPSGALVALTELVWPLANPASIEQWTTLVNAEHRGHRLGMWAKAANLRQLLDVNPSAARVHTTNAVENRHMLAINETLGFVSVAGEGAWQKKL